MMYDVEWVPAANEELAAIWMLADDRAAVSRAVYRLDEALGREPLRLGESRESSVRRVVSYDMLTIAFEVVEDDKRVHVHGVLRYR